VRIKTQDVCFSRRVFLPPPRCVTPFERQQQQARHTRRFSKGDGQRKFIKCRNVKLAGEQWEFMLLSFWASHTDFISLAGFLFTSKAREILFAPLCDVPVEGRDGESGPSESGNLMPKLTV
jgi:hypothetical protein